MTTYFAGRKGVFKMNFIGALVQHKAFGEGTVTAFDEKYIKVHFTLVGDKKFVYPNAFNGFIVAEDGTIAAEIKKDIKKKEGQETIRKAEEKIKWAELAQKQKKISLRNRPAHAKKHRVCKRSNIAFKCNYCDGGQSLEQIGFNGVCSDKTIHNNICVEKRTWCSSDECACKEYLNDNISRKELDLQCMNGGFVCYESQMLRDWKALAGVVQRGARKNEPMKLHEVQKNSLCVLTTSCPQSSETERFIFAVFLVDESYEGDNQKEGYVTTKSKYKIKLSLEESKQMLFWDYHTNQKKTEVAAWRSGLHRYFDDNEAIQILTDIVALKKGTKDENLAMEFMDHFIKVNGVDLELVPEKNGALMQAKICQ